MRSWSSTCETVRCKGSRLRTCTVSENFHGVPALLRQQSARGSCWSAFVGNALYLCVYGVRNKDAEVNKRLIVP